VNDECKDCGKQPEYDCIGCGDKVCSDCAYEVDDKALCSECMSCVECPKRGTLIR